MGIPEPVADPLPGGFRRVLETVTVGLVDLLAAQLGLVYLLTRREEAFVPLFSVGVLSPEVEAHFKSVTLLPTIDPLAHAMRQGRSPLLQPRSPFFPLFGNLHWMAVPIRSGADLLGMTVVARPLQAAPFQEQDAERAAAILRAVAFGLDNARLVAETEERLAERQSLHEIALALLQNLDVSALLEIVCQGVQRQLRAEASVVALLGDEGLETVYASGGGYTRGESLPPEDPFLGEVVRRGAPLLLREPPFLALPLRVHGAVIGAMAVLDRPGGFLPGDVRPLQQYVDQAALAVMQSRLLEQVGTLAVVEERQRLARELHDSVNQSLYSIGMFTQAAQKQLERQDYAAVGRHLANISASAKDALGDMRRLIFELRPSALQARGLEAALQDRLKTVEGRVGLETGLKVRLDGRLPERVEFELFQIAQEALNNVIKHAQAKRVMIYVIQSGQVLRLVVEDNGRGFIPEPEGGGLGLKTMRERSDHLGAQLHLESVPGHGTRVVVELNLEP